MKLLPACKFVFESTGGLWTIVLSVQGRHQTALKAVRDGARLRLSDIVIESDRLMHHGIGNQLLDMLISRATAEGIVEIYGSVTHDDIAKTPYLLDWYQRRGFLISEPDQECTPNAEKKIVFKIT